MSIHPRSIVPQRSSPNRAVAKCARAAPTTPFSDVRFVVAVFVAIGALSACRSAPAHRAQLPDPRPARALAATFGDETVEDPERAALAEAGELDEANAAWWGFDPENATEALQAAIDSGVRLLRVPDMGEPWIVEPIELRSHQEILFEDGAEVLALRGAFRGRFAALFTAWDTEDVTLRGYGATFRMWKRDYQRPDYDAGEWRHMISLRGAHGFEILGLTLLSSGGDGIYVGRSRDNGSSYSSDVTVRDVIADDHHRQGMSVISVENLLIENSRFTNTRGT